MEPAPTETRFVRSRDGTRIAYDVTGAGPVLMLLHGGFIQTRRDWHTAHVERLKSGFSVITVDLRGHGESDRPATAEAYAPERMLDDLSAVVDACGASQYMLWGYSLGATIALQAAARSEQVRGTIVTGAWFGTLFTEPMVSAFLARAETVARARAEGKLDDLEMSPPERDFFTNVDLSVMMAYYRALVDYPAVDHHQLLCPALVLAGTDNAPAAAKLIDREEDIRAAGLKMRLF